jgi:hypothetical protein
MRKGPPPVSNDVPEIRTMHGLYLQPNTFNVPDGALETAQNIVTKDDQTLTSRRGYYEYFEGTGTYNNLFTYENTLLGFYDNKAAYYTDTGSAPNLVGVEHTLTGESFTLSGTTRSLQSNSNLYFTADQGILKITSFDSAISKAGAPPGLDISLNYDVSTTATWFEAGNTVGYRVLFGYVDANDNTILGAPSQIAQINNPAVTGLSYTTSGGGPWTVTVTSNDHGLQTGDILLISNGTDADADGTHAITVTGTNSFTYSVSSASPGSGTLDYAYGMAVLVEMSVPSEISTALPWFYRVYRSSQNQISVGIFSDFELVAENMLTSAEISAGVAFFADTVDDLLRSTILYTNENSGEGELQANNRPPLAQDMAVFHNYALYANCTTRHLLNLNVIDPTVMVSGDYIEIKVDATTRRYVARTGVGNSTVFATCSSSAGLLITYDAHGFVNNDTVYIANVVGGTLTSGTYYVVSATTNNFKISLTSGGAVIAYGGETNLTVEGDTNGTYSIFQLSESDSAAERIAQTANGIVRAVNRDSSSLIYAQYTTAIDEVPGKMTFQAKAFTGTIYVRANTTTAGTAFSPNLPDSFASGTQVASKNDELPNVIYISKLGEPEAVPLINFLPAGSKNYPIYRIVALRDTVIIVKADGVWRMTGDSLTNFIITLLDSTVILVATSSLDVLNNQVIFLSNQGVCLVSESSVQIISRAKIEDEIQPILGQTNLSSQTSGIGYETERLYLLTTTLPNETTAQVTWCYNILTNEWTSWDTLFTQAEIGPNDTMYYVSFDNRILKERKSQTAIDYSDQNYIVSIDSIDGVDATITITGSYSPREGDMIVKDDVITWIDAEPVLTSGSTYDVVFNSANNLEAGDSEILYSSFYHIIKFSPFHAGLLSKMKVFSQFQVHLRNASMTRAIFTFTGYALGGSGEITWESLLTFEGWGSFPWGFEPWGQGNGINLSIGTTPAPVCRVLVPAFQARNTFIQAQIEHRKAGEPLNIQAISYVVRPYNERVSR